jgi:hypothetical protein
MIVSFYTRTVDEVLVRPFWALRHWAHRHPAPFRILVAFTIAVFLIGWPTIVFAADDSPIEILPGLGVTDSAGTPVWRYTLLPIDRGNGFDGKLLVAGPLDLLWAFHVFVVSWMLWLCEWVVSFQWVDWIASPFLLIANTVQTILGQLNWIPFALAIAGGVGATMVVLGRVGKGVSELLISAVCAILAVGFFANPVAEITKPGGFLDTAQEYGGELAAVMVTDDINAVDGDTEDLLQDSVTGQLADIFLRTPAQVISFGRVLEGTCADTFDEKMKGGYDWQSGFLGIPSYGEVTIDDVRDAVRDCDEAAKSFNENPSFLSVITMIIVNNGSASIFFLPIAILILFVLSTIGGLWAGLKTMWHTFVGILPVNRSALWRSALDTVIGISMIVVLTVFLAGSLRFTGDMMNMIAAAGVPLVMQMGFVQLVTLVIVFLLIRAKMQAKKAGRTLAQQLARFGANGGAVPPKRSMAGAVIGGSLGTALINGGAKVLAAKHSKAPMSFDNRSINMFGQTPSQAAPDPIDLHSTGNVPPAPPSGGPSAPALPGGGPSAPQLPPSDGVPALPAGRGEGPKDDAKPAKTAKATQAVGTVARIAKGLPGGLPGVAAAAAKEIGTTVVLNGAAKALDKAQGGSADANRPSTPETSAQRPQQAPKPTGRPAPGRPASGPRIVPQNQGPASPAEARGGSARPTLRRISVDSSGTAHVDRQQRRRPVVYNISSLPPRPVSSSAQQLREKLAASRSAGPVPVSSMSR